MLITTIFASDKSGEMRSTGKCMVLRMGLNNLELGRFIVLLLGFVGLMGGLQLQTVCAERRARVAVRPVHAWAGRHAGAQIARARTCCCADGDDGARASLRRTPWLPPANMGSCATTCARARPLKSEKGKHGWDVLINGQNSLHHSDEIGSRLELGFSAPFQSSGFSTQSSSHFPGPPRLCSSEAGPACGRNKLQWSSRPRPQANGMSFCV
jgi:hypothetical protein